MQNYPTMFRRLFALTALMLFLGFSTTAFAQVVLMQKGNAKVVQYPDGWRLMHGNEVIAHGDGAFNTKKVHPLFQEIFDNCAAVPESQRIRKTISKAATIEYGPFLKTEWNQDEPFNQLFPVISYTESNGNQVQEQTVTGCSTISTGQVLNYYRYCLPLKASGTNTAQCKITNTYFGITKVYEPTSTGRTSFDYSINYTPDFEKINSDDNELSKFLLSVAFIQKAYFGPQTATNNSEQAKALKDVFGYDVSIYDNLSSMAQGGYIENAIKQGHPIIAGGGAHSYIIDGIKGDEYHIDLGWGGASNGWYTQEAFEPLDFLTGFGIMVAVPKPFVSMQSTPKTLHIKGNGVEKTMTLQLQNSLEYKATATLDAGTYDFYFEYDDGTLIAPYTNSIIALSKDNKEYCQYGSFVEQAAQFTIPNTLTIDFVHNAAKNEIKVVGVDFEVNISGKVPTTKTAYVSLSPTKPVEKIYGNKLGNTGMGTMVGKEWYTKNSFTVDEECWLGKFEFYTFHYGEPSDVVVMLLDQNLKPLSESFVSPDKLSSGSTLVELNNFVLLSPGNTYYFALKMAEDKSDNDKVYARLADNNDVAFQAYTYNEYCVLTDKDGNYSIAVNNPFFGKLYAFADGESFAPLSFNNVTKNLTGQNFVKGSSEQNTVVGKVLDQNSEGIAYAEVSLSIDKADGKTVKTDPYGNYSIDVEKGFSGNLYAFADGYTFEPITLNNVSGVLKEQNFKGVDNSVTISGKVLGENSMGIGGAVVSLSSDKSNGVTTASDGSFVITVAKNTDATLYVFADDCSFEPLALGKLTADAKNKIITELPKYVTVSGKLLDKDGNPIANAYINDANSLPQLKLDLVNDATEVGWVLGDMQTSFEAKQSYISKIEIKIYNQNNPGNWYFKVSDEQNNPLIEKTLTVADIKDRNDWTAIEVGLPVVVGKKYFIYISGTYKSETEWFMCYSGADNNLAYKVYGIDAKAITANDGSYSASVKRHSDVTLYAFSDYAEFEPLVLTDVANNLENQNFKLKGNAEDKFFTISGFVLDENSEAIAGAEVSVSEEKPENQTVVTDDDGAYSIRLANGYEGKLYAFARGYEFEPYEIDGLEQNYDDVNFSGEKIKEYVTLSGRVLDENSQPLSSAEVSLSSNKEDGQTVTTDKNGNYSITVEKNFTGKLYAFADGYSFEPLEVSKATANVSNLDFKGKKIIITFTVSGQVIGENYAGVVAEVSISPNKDKNQTVVTDNEGFFTINVESGFSGKLYAFAKDYQFEPVELTNVDRNIEMVNIKGVVVSECKTVTISGTVFDKTMNPVAGAEVYTSTDGEAVVSLDCQNTTESECYYVDNSDFLQNYTASAFTPKQGKISKIEFRVFYEGKPGNLSVAIIDNSQSVLWQKSLAKSNIKNDSWTSVDLDLSVTPSQNYYIVIKAEKQNTERNYYAYYETENEEGMQYKVYTVTGGAEKKSVTTANDGSYTFEIDNGSDVTLYASYGDLEYKPLTFTNVRKNLEGKDFVPVGAAEVVESQNVTISGKVYDEFNKPLADALISASETAPKMCSSHDKCETCWAFAEHEIDFVADAKYLTKFDFMISKEGSTGNLTVSVLDESKREIWKQVYTNDETTAWQWKEVSLDKSLELVVGNHYSIKLATVASNSGTYYYVMDQADRKTVHRIFTSDYPTVKSASDGSYSYTVEKGSSGALHAFSDDRNFNAVNYSEIADNASGKDFRVLSGVVNIKGNGITPVSDVKSADGINVWSYDHTIYIENAPVNAKYQIIDLNGRVLTTSNTTSSKEEVRINATGIYVVVINNIGYKVAIR